MSGKQNHSRGVAARAFFVAVLLGLCIATTNAASISYGNFGPIPPGVTFTNVTESSGTDAVPLFGPPTPFVTGLDFDPANFIASANGGASDITDGQLNFGILSNPFGISNISLFEAGDYSLVGTGTAATQDFAGAIMRITVTQIDGVNVAPINLAPANASVSFNLAANPGIVQPWSLGLNYNVALALSNAGFQGAATGLEVVIDNQLIAVSQTNSLAFIDKKDFQISVTTNVPEPGSVALLGFGGLVAAAAWFRRRRS